VKIHRFFYGMVNGKVTQMKTEGVNQILSDSNFQRLKSLGVEDSDKYLWLPTEQVIAVPHITETVDKAGRKFVRNETLLIPIHEFLKFTDPALIFSPFFLDVDDIPESLEPLEIDKSTLRVASKTSQR
jgi:hypothetical protein